VHGTDGTLLNDTSEHAPGTDVKGAEQMTDAAADVLELVSNASVGTAAIRSTTTERLHGLFVDTDHDSVGWRLQIELADAADLLRKIGIRAVQPVPNAMRSQSFAAQNTLYSAAADAHARLTVQRTGESALRPNGAAYISLVFRSSAGKLDELTARF